MVTECLEHELWACPLTEDHTGPKSGEDAHYVGEGYVTLSKGPGELWGQESRHGITSHIQAQE